jgi:hypothetical protein
MRDEFSPKDKDTLAKRVGYHCSSPNCRALTAGPQEDPMKVLNVGVASHITAASPDGPRYDNSLTSEQRSSLENGIWLCQKCGKLIDNEPTRYTVETLREWKKQAEQNALHAVESGSRVEALNSIFSGDIDVIFSQSRSSQINLKAFEKFEFPSEVAKKNILAELERRRKNPALNPLFNLPSMDFFKETPLSEMNLDDLNKELDCVTQKYADADCYALYETHSNKFNLTIINHGTEYIIDGHIELYIPKNERIFISDRIFNKPSDYPFRTLPAINSGYPKIEGDDSSTTISQNTGDIRHKIPQRAFHTDIRIIFSQELIGQEIECLCKIFGKNLPDPIEKHLKIIVTPS